MVISDEVIATFGKYTQDSVEKTEAGGLLLGFRRKDHFEIIHATEPTKFDSRTRTHWIRSDKIHSDIAKQLWLKSNRQITYLGEWHTHPEKIPYPSGIDLGEWKKLSQECKYSGGYGMIIVGIQELWCGICTKDTIIKMDKID